MNEFFKKYDVIETTRGKSLEKGDTVRGNPQILLLYRLDISKNVSCSRNYF